jgi:hypothetical protein
MRFVVTFRPVRRRPITWTRYAVDQAAATVSAWAAVLREYPDGRGGAAVQDFSVAAG